MVGEVNDVPLPTNVPPDDKLYQDMLPLVGGVAVTMAVPKAHKVLPDVTAAVGNAFMVAITAVLGLSQLPAALIADTQRVVVEEIPETVALPEPALPPVATLYQFNVPPEETALSTTLVEVHPVAGTVETMVGVIFIVAITAVLLAVVPIQFTAST